MTDYRSSYLVLFTGVFGLVGCEDATVDLHGELLSAKGVAAGSGGTASNSASPSQTGASARAAQCLDFTSGTPGTWKPFEAWIFDLTNPTARDEAASLALLNSTLAEVEPSVGSGAAPGTLKLAIPFAAVQSTEQGIVVARGDFTKPLNLVGRELTAYVKLDGGMTPNDPAYPYGAGLMIRTGEGEQTIYWENPSESNLVPDEWVQVTFRGGEFALHRPADLTDVREIGIIITTNDFATQIETPAIVHIDHICF